LVLVDDASKDPVLTDCLESFAEQTNIKWLERAENGHISNASNGALAMATGDYIALLHQDDLLHPDALLCMAHFIQDNPQARVLYSDEDKLNTKGERHTPHFKPAWSPDLLYSHNYISHLGVYQRALVEQVGGFREGYEGSQDYDLLLRCVAQLKSDNIIHVPYVLYHWRALKGSTALKESEKSYSQQAGLMALTEHLANKGCDVQLGELPNTYKVNWPLPTPAPLVSIIIPTKNAQGLVKQCIDSIAEKTDYANYEILLIDNGSDEVESLAYFDQLKAAGAVRLLTYNKAFNYSAINNFAVEHAQGSILVLMNNDIEILSSTWLTDMVANASREDIGCVGAKLYYPDGTLQHAGVIGGLGGVAGHSHKHFRGDHSGYFKRLKVTQNLTAVTAACLAVRKSVFDQVGGLNETDLTIAFNDVDFCLKVQAAGYRNLWSPYIEMIHHESVSRGAEDTPEKQARFLKEIAYMKNTWSQELMNDPYYSPWLTLDREDFTYR
jgi:GT2 family glycosyltransferase